MKMPIIQLTPKTPIRSTIAPVKVDEIGLAGWLVVPVVLEVPEVRVEALATGRRSLARRLWPRWILVRVEEHLQPVHLHRVVAIRLVSSVSSEVERYVLGIVCFLCVFLVREVNR